MAADSSAIPKWLQKSSTGSALNPRSSENLRAHYFFAVEIDLARQVH
jgi:hypothetical protein